MQRLLKLIEALENWGLQCYFVGGCVRDELMGRPIEDHDICVVGGRTQERTGYYLNYCKDALLIDELTLVHGSFPIWIVGIDGVKYEVAMARSERKTGQSRTEFACEVRDVSIEEDLRRRDLTINAIAKRILTGELIDPFYGRTYIEKKIAAPVSEAFKEDSLRVYRAARFIAQFNLRPSARLMLYCAQLTPEDMSNERVGMELKKTLQRAQQPSKFFVFLKRVGWLKHHFLELNDLRDVPQSLTHHLEGDAFTHTLHSMDQASDWFTRTVMLCHDLGKAVTTTVDGISYRNLAVDAQSKIKALGHEEAGVELTRRLLQRIHFSDHHTIRQITCLVKNHMIRALLNEGNREKMVRRTLRELMDLKLTYAQLVEVVRCDLAGRPPLPPIPCPDIGQELAAHLLEQGLMTPVVTGKKLLEIGISSGPEMGRADPKRTGATGPGYP
jgi:tRNA nucleotidyltransferase (CCA-adding enzyme)